jgi:hypothetical protein
MWRPSRCSLHQEELRLENVQGSLQSRISGSVPTVKYGRRFCDGLVSNIVVQCSVGPIITLHGRITAREYVDRLGNQVHPMIQTAMQFSKTTVPPPTQLELFSHGLKSMKVNFSIFPDQYNLQI